MITIKDFAAKRGCSETIVYRHIRKHREELGENVQKNHGKTFLTPEGESFILGLMKIDATVLSPDETTRRVEEKYRKLIEEKDQTIEDLKDDLLQTQRQIIDLQNDRQLLEASHEDEIKRLDGLNTRMAKEIVNLKDDAQKASNELTEVQEALEAEKNVSKNALNELGDVLERESKLKDRIRELENAGLFRRIFGWKKR